MLNKIKITLPISILLAAIYAFFAGGSYFFAFLPAMLLFFLSIGALTFLLEKAGNSHTLMWMTALALLLRLITALALHTLLPINGYPDSEQQQAGYVFFDAYRRDTAAYELALSDAPLLTAFSQKEHTDQYGGLLALSAGVYRYLSPDSHRPLLIVLIAALTATLGVPFFWLAAKELGGEKLATTATWVFALYPEAILMGSSQMREPFLISFTAIALWGFLRWQKEKKAQWALGAAISGMLLISPAIALITIIFLGVYALISQEKSRITIKQLAIALLFLLLSLFLLSSALSATKLDATSPLGIIAEWTKRAISWDIYQLERGSGWVQKLFSETPEAIHLPFVIGYGLAQPVLPAALIEPTTATWKVLGILRALGWYALALFLLYGLFTLPKHKSPLMLRVWTWIGLGNWFWIIVASLRAGGDQWDNPRYRVIFIALQALFAAQAWIMHKERVNAWLPRLLTVEAIFLAFFTQWYASRYYVRFGALSFGAMVAWILSLSLLVVGFGIFQDRKGIK